MQKTQCKRSLLYRYRETSSAFECSSAIAIYPVMQELLRKRRSECIQILHFNEEKTTYFWYLKSIEIIDRVFFDLHRTSFITCYGFMTEVGKSSLKSKSSQVKSDLLT